MALIRRGFMTMNLPVKLDTTVDRIETDYDPDTATPTEAIRVTVHNNDGSSVILKGATPLVTATGISMTLTP